MIPPLPYSSDLPGASLPPQETHLAPPAHPSTARNRNASSSDSGSTRNSNTVDVVITITSEEDVVPAPGPGGSNTGRPAPPGARAGNFPASRHRDASGGREAWLRNLPRHFDTSRLFAANMFCPPTPQHTEIEVPAPIAPGGNTVSLDHSAASVKSYYSELDEIPAMQRAKIEEMVIHSAIANSLYYDYESELLKAERIVKSNPGLAQTSWKKFLLPEDVQTALGLETYDDGRLYDKNSHLVALMLQNDEQRSIAVAFGGTSSGKNKGTLIYRLIRNPLTTFLQWSRNFQSLGLHFLKAPVPDSYLKAAEIAHRVQDLITANPSDAYHGYSFSLAGHSKGAAEAEYAALMHPPTRAFCFSTPPLGRRLLKTVPQENFEVAKENIQHYFVKHDAVPAVRTLLKPVLDTSHVGRARWLPAPPHVVTGPLYPLWAHDLFHDCVTDYAHKSILQELDPDAIQATRITIHDATTDELENQLIHLDSDLSARLTVSRNDDATRS